MKKVFLVVMSLILIISLAGCTKKETKEYVYLQKENEDIQRIVKITSNTNEIMTYTLDHKIRYVMKNNFTFLTARLNNKEFSIVCGYINEDLYTPKRLREDNYIENLKWIVYDKISDIKKHVDDLVLSDAFIVYNFLLEKDLVNNVEYNTNLKYYRDVTNEVEWKLHDGSLFNEEIDINQILLWVPMHSVNTKDLYITDFDIHNSVEIIKENDNNFFAVLDKSIIYNGKESDNLLKVELNTFYDILSTKIIDDEKLDKKIVNDDLSFYIIKKAKLNIDYIINIIRNEVS